jgi:hypothetical protein
MKDLGNADLLKQIVNVWHQTHVGIRGNGSRRISNGDCIPSLFVIQLCM